MSKFFKFLAPRHTVGIAALGSVAVCLIVVLNWVFIYAVFGFFPHSPLFYAFQTIVVGAPFVVISNWISVSQAKLQRELSLLSRKDGLTGLNNRRIFLTLAEKRLREEDGGVLLLLDADHFKQINDSWGHGIGDVCLAEIAHRLKWNLRPHDVAGRVGGEEFAVLLTGATLHQARVIADRIGQPITFDAGEGGKHRTVTLSIGGVQVDPNISLGIHLSRADAALYEAKEAGRACLRFWTPPEQFDQRSA